MNKSWKQGLLHKQRIVGKSLSIGFGTITTPCLNFKQINTAAVAKPDKESVFG